MTKNLHLHAISATVERLLKSNSENSIMLFWQRENIARAPNGAVIGPMTLAETREAEEKKFREEIIEVVNKIYDKNSKPAIAVVDGLVKQYGNPTLSDEARQAFVKSAKDTLSTRVKMVEQHANVLRKQAEVKRSQENPGEIDLNTLVPEMKSKMGYGNRRWLAASDPYGPQYDDMILSQDKIDEIKEDSSSTFYTKPSTGRSLPFIPSYKRLLHAANKQTSMALADNSRDLNALIETGKPLPPKSSNAKAAEGVLGAGASMAEQSLNAFHSIFNAAGKGIYSKSDPNQSSYLREYYDKRNKLFSNLLWSLEPGQSKNSKLLQRFKKILEDSENEDGLLDEKSFSELTKIITEEIKKDEGANKEQMTKFNERINDLNKKVLESAKEQTEDSDAMFKWRVLQVALIITPFAGVSIMGPITNIFSGVFMNAGGIGQGIASLATSEYTGPFGQLCEWLHLDEVIRWLLCDMPVISDAVGVVDSALSSDLVQGVLEGAIVPLAGSSIVPVAIAGVFSLFRANSEIAYFTKYGDAFKGHEKAIREELSKIEQEALDRGGLNAKEFVDKKFNILRDFYYKASLVNYAAEKFQQMKSPAGDDKFFNEIMGPDFVEAVKNYRARGEDERIHKVFNEDGNISNKELMNFLAKNPDRQDFYDNILLFCALEKKAQEADRGGIVMDKVMADFIDIRDNHPESAAELLKEAKNLQKEEYILRLAIDRGIDCSKVLDQDEFGASKGERANALKEVENKIKEEEARLLDKNPLDVQRSKIAKNLLPMSPANILRPDSYSSSPLIPSGRPVSVGGFK